MSRFSFDELEQKIPRGKVRTRFAPSPTGYMHIGNLRTALYAYLIAKRSGGTFILRLEDTDTARFIEGATEIIIDTLKGTGLIYDEGPDIGGPVAPYTQSERKHIYLPYAELLCEKGAAYYCFCEKTEDDPPPSSPDDPPPSSPAVGDGVLDVPLSSSPAVGRGLAPADGVVDDPPPSSPAVGTTAPGRPPRDWTDDEIDNDPCRDLPYAESKKRVETGEPFIVRLKAPREGTTTVTDMVFGVITARNDTLDDMVLIKRDGMPTYNFANVIDDHLMGITHVVRGNEYISSAPKYNLLYQSFGWEIPVYVTVSPVMRDAQHKLSKRRGDPTYADLLDMGYLPDAVLNYVALLGWSPGGEREFFTLQEMTGVFDISGISKSPAIFDTEKLNYFNGEYIRAMPPEEFAEKAKPYIQKAVKNTSLPIDAIAAILQPRCDKLSDIPEKIDFFDELPDYPTELYIHKKSKTDEAISLNMLQAALAGLEDLTDWANATVHDMFIALAEKLGVKNATLMWPVRIAVSGKSVTPGGAVEICGILGREETLRRITAGIKKLEESL